MSSVSPIGIPNSAGYLKNNGTGVLTWNAAVASKTIAAQSIYVDNAATGTGDGTSWTNAFVTIQAAINSLPTVLENAVTIYVRKGTTAYSKTLTVQQISGKGSLTICGEYFWNGQCAAAGTPAANKFRLTATDGENIAAGDLVLVTSRYGGPGSYKYYVYTTVSSVSSIGGNVYEITLTDSLDSGNIGTTEFYTIVKTSVSGVLTVSASTVSTTGIYLTGCSITDSARVHFKNTFIVSATTAISCASGGNFSSQSCYLYGASYTLNLNTNALSYLGTYSATDGQYCTVIASSSARVISSSQGFLQIESCILHITNVNGIGIYATSGSMYLIARSSIVITPGITGTTGIYCLYSSTVRTVSINNTQVATPKNPASATDPSYIV
jgi:hypothetical protein